MLISQSALQSDFKISACDRNFSTSYATKYYHSDVSLDFLENAYGEEEENQESHFHCK